MPSEETKYEFFDEDEDLDILSLKKNIEKDIINQKEIFVKTVLTNGDDQLKDIEKKKQKRELNKKQKIEYLIKYATKYSIDVEELYEMNSDEITLLYNDIVHQNRSFFRKLIEMFT